MIRKRKDDAHKIPHRGNGSEIRNGDRQFGKNRFLTRRERPREIPTEHRGSIPRLQTPPFENRSRERGVRHGGLRVSGFENPHPRTGSPLSGGNPFEKGSVHRRAFRLRGPARRRSPGAHPRPRRNHRRRTDGKSRPGKRHGNHADFRTSRERLKNRHHRHARRQNRKPHEEARSRPEGRPRRFGFALFRIFALTKT